MKNKFTMQALIGGLAMMVAVLAIGFTLHILRDSDNLDKPKIEQRSMTPYCRITEPVLPGQTLEKETWIYDQDACDLLDISKPIWETWNTRPDIFNQCDYAEIDSPGGSTLKARIVVTPVDEQTIVWWNPKLYRASGRAHPSRKIKDEHIDFCGKVWRLGEKNGKYAVLLGAVMVNPPDSRVTKNGYSVGKRLRLVWMTPAEYYKLAKHAATHYRADYH